MQIKPQLNANCIDVMHSRSIINGDIKMRPQEGQFQTLQFNYIGSYVDMASATSLNQQMRDQ